MALCSTVYDLVGGWWTWLGLLLVFWVNGCVVLLAIRTRVTRWLCVAILCGAYFKPRN